MRLVNLFNKNYFEQLKFRLDLCSSYFERIELNEGIKLQRKQEDPPMTLRVFDLNNHENPEYYKVLNLSLHARYWNKVTTFKNFGNDSLLQANSKALLV